MDKNQHGQSNILAEKSVAYLIDQCFQAINETKIISFPDEYKNIKNIVVCGMGGSSFASHIVNSLFEFKMPFVINEDYSLPSWADTNTLVILSSYSGDTEEILICADQAKGKNCKITGLTSGGKLNKFFIENNLPFYLFEPKYNPGNMPRFGPGYGIFGLIGILANLEIIINLTHYDLENEFNDSIKKLSLEIVNIRKDAENFAKRCGDNNICIFSSEHLIGNGHIFTNELNETAKTLTFHAVIPEADHNLILGFTGQVKNMSVIFLQSENYDKKIKARFDVTKNFIEENKNSTLTYQVPKGLNLFEMLSVLLFSSYFSLELAKIKNVDPLECDILGKIKKKLLLTT